MTPGVTRGLVRLLAIALSIRAVCVSDKPVISTMAKAIDREAPQRVNDKTSRAAIAALQIRLHRAHYSAGPIDGTFGRNLTNAVLAYNRSHGISASADPSLRAWRALESDHTPLVTDYSISVQDIAAPLIGKRVDQTVKGLRYSSYSSPLEGLSERFRSSPALLRELNPGASFSVPGTRIQVPNVQDRASGSAMRLLVSKSERSLTVFDKASRVLAYYPVSFGSERDPLPLDIMKVESVVWYPTYYYDPRLLWDAPELARRSEIAPGPNSPVGVVWIELTKNHWGLHGTPDPASVGYKSSHGCIRLANWDAAELATLVSKGTSVQVGR